MPKLQEKPENANLRHVPLKYASKEALAGWLDQKPWHLWTTFTTAYELTLPSARRSMIRMFDRVNQDNKSAVFWAAEKFDAKDGFHLHTLWTFQNEIYDRKLYKEFVNNWRVVSKTNKAAVYSERYQKEFGAHNYLAKYITKAITDYDYFDANLMNKESINDNVTPYNLKGRNESAKRKGQRICNSLGMGDYGKVKQEYEENKSQYNDLEKVRKEIYGY